jgi:hypothetical protein
MSAITINGFKREPIDEGIMTIKRMTLFSVLAFMAAFMLTAGAAIAEEKKAAHEGKSADQVAKELSNPAGSLASLFFSLEYYTYKGDLPDADDQDGFTFAFQPVLPFPVGDKGRRIIFRPLVPVPINQPVFDNEIGRGKPIKVYGGTHTTYVVPGIGEFEDGDVNLGDITFDLVYAGTDMVDKHNGYLWGIGAAGTFPTATDDDFAGDQWRLGPEIFAGVIRKWITFGAVLNHQWNVAGSNDDYHSVTAGQYFYAIGLGNGWQIASGPTFSYDWQADSDQAWTLPVGIGIAKTVKIGTTPTKFQLQLQYFVEQPDAFGPEWLLKFTVTPVVKNVFASWFR